MTRTRSVSRSARQRDRALQNMKEFIRYQRKQRRKVTTSAVAFRAVNKSSDVPPPPLHYSTPPSINPFSPSDIPFQEAGNALGYLKLCGGFVGTQRLDLEHTKSCWLSALRHKARVLRHAEPGLLDAQRLRSFKKPNK
ncbi:hypothetical protein EVAR_101903_1 [Eumeta japonica]|uniref:Uncharacterized protein n=1 Tax=Eumeta variegata TaxID=151549 RepID=A0A4C1T5V1_EUMVA|nr:hypothetical protein EVAR_101903_1 [Eumeta japonica]